MLNETIANLSSGSLGDLNYDKWTSVTNNPIFIVGSIIVWLLPLIIMIIIGASVKGGNSGSGKRMIEFPNFWYLFFLYFFFQLALFLSILIFPVWLEWMG